MSGSVLATPRVTTDQAPIHDDSEKPPTSRGRALAGVAAVVVLWSALCEFVLRVSVWWDMAPPWVMPFLVNDTNLVGVLFIATLILWLLAASGRLWVALAASLVLSLGVAAANRVKLDTLLEPVVPFDVEFVTQPDALMNDASWWSLAAVVVAAGVCVPVVRSATRRFGRSRTPQLLQPFRPRTLLLVRALTVIVLGALLASSVNFNRDQLNPWGHLFAWTDPDWRAWDQGRNYAVNGFVGGFLYNMPVRAMEEPPGYSAASVEAIAARYAAPQQPATELPNIVVVLSEAFTDPQAVPGYTLDEDVIPRIRAVMENTWSGRVVNSAFGHGTSTAEFEVLTSQVTGLFEPRMTTPFQMLIPGLDSYPSVVGWATERGYRTTAVHPYSPNMYRRIPVYRTLGFDEFVYDERMTHQESVESNPYISDDSAFDEVLDRIDRTEQPSLVHLVTMQNHFPTDGHYTDVPDVTGVDAATEESIAGYARGLSYTDEAVHEFLTSLGGLDEETVVVFFGDHHPPIYDEERLGADHQSLVETPFFIWASDAEPERRDLGVISASRLLPLAFQRAGIPSPGMYRLAEDVGSRVGTLHGPAVITGPDESTALSDLTGTDAALLDDMRMVQYDLSIGRRYGWDALWR